MLWLKMLLIPKLYVPAALLLVSTSIWVANSNRNHNMQHNPFIGTWEGGSTEGEPASLTVEFTIDETYRATRTDDMLQATVQGSYTLLDHNHLRMSWRDLPQGAESEASTEVLQYEQASDTLFLRDQHQHLIILSRVTR